MSERGETASGRTGRLTVWTAGLTLAAVLLPLAFLLKFPASRSASVTAVLSVAAADDFAGTAVESGRRQREALYRQTQANLIKTRLVLESATRQPRVSELSVIREHADPASWLEKALQVEAREDTRTIHVSLSGDRPDELAMVVNAVARAYLKEVAAPEREQQLKRLADCERVYQENLDAIHQKLAELQALYRRGPLEAVGDLPHPSAGAMRKELESVSAQLEKARLQREQQRKKAAGDAEVPDDLIDEQLDKDLRAGKLREQQERLQRIITEYEKVARDGPDVPELVSSSLRGYKADLEAVKKQLQERRRETRERVQRQLKQFNDEAARQNLKRLDDDIALLIAEEQTLRQRLAEQAKDVEKHSRGSAAEVEKLLKEIERRQGVVKAFGDECAARRRDILAAPRVVLVQEAAAP